MNARQALLPLLFVTGCYPATGAAPAPVSPVAAMSASARWPDATPDSLESGRQLFLANCNRCHGYPALEKIEQDRWPSIVKRMSKKADLVGGDPELLLRFILVDRGSATSGTP
jgi:cytochrome c5